MRTTTTTGSVDEARGARGGEKRDGSGGGGKRFLISASVRSEGKSGERAEGKTNNERFLRSFVGVDVAVVIGDASPTNLIRTDTSECAPSSSAEEREEGKKSAPCSSLQCEREREGRKKWAVRWARTEKRAEKGKLSSLHSLPRGSLNGGGLSALLPMNKHRGEGGKRDVDESAVIQAKASEDGGVSALPE